MSSPVNYVEPFCGTLAAWLCHPKWGAPRPFPAPYFGGKSRAAQLIWDRFGCAELPKVATANDLNGFVANVMRSMAADAEAVARWCDWPVSEVDLHARHRWLLKMARKLRARLEADPVYFDPRMAGWWIWGASQWLGSGWCEEGKAPSAEMPVLAGNGGTKARGEGRLGYGNGILGAGMREPPHRLPDLGGGAGRPEGDLNVRAGKGVHGATMREPSRQLPALSGSCKNGEPVTNYGAGVFGASMRGPSRSLPDLGSRAPDGKTQNSVGKGTHASGMQEPSRQLPGLNRNSSGAGILGNRIRTVLDDVFDEIQRRLRPIVRFACGDFERVLTPAVTYRHGLTAVLLDPVYIGFEYVYGDIAAEGEKEHCARRAEAWAREAGKRDDMRIALCGYEGHYDLPGWEVVPWKARGGYSNQSGNNENAAKERIWFSPACLKPGRDFGQVSLF